MWKSLRFAKSTTDSEMLECLSRTAAERSVPHIFERLGEVAGRMSMAEVRGYVRARAGKVVRHQLALVAAEQGGVNSPMLLSLQHKALERAVHLVVKELMARPAASLPLRLAA